MSDYDVGRGKPPKHTRFQKGKGGNPKGRPLGRRNIRTDIVEELAVRVPVTIDGRRRMLSKQTILVKRLIAEALSGDAKARDTLMRVVEKIDPPPPAETVERHSAEADARILAEFEKRLAARLEKQRSKK